MQRLLKLMVLLGAPAQQAVREPAAIIEPEVVGMRRGLKLMLLRQIPQSIEVETLGIWQRVVSVVKNWATRIKQAIRRE